MGENLRKQLLRELRDRHTAFAQRFRSLDEESDRQIVRWRYALSSAFDLRADYFRRINTRQAVPFSTEPVSSPHYFAYGYDAQDRIIYIASFALQELPVSAAFILYAPNHVDLLEYSPMGSNAHLLGRVGRLITADDGKPRHYAEIAYTVMGEASTTYERYGYDDSGRLSHIHEARHHSPFMSLRYTYVADLLYRYEGDRLKHITTRFRSSTLDSTYNSITYQAHTRNENDATLFAAVRQSLKTAITEHVRQYIAQRTSEKVYCLVMSYDAVVDDGILVTLGYQKDRQHWEKDHYEYSYRALRFDAPVPSDSHFTMSDLPPDFVRFMLQMREEERYQTIRTLFNQVARDLNEVDWQGILDVTDDFIVFANDYEALEDTHDEIYNCVPEDKIRMLVASGLLDERIQD
ncbi:MAG: hypothetical protein SF123_16690 [Chloroflexota bacterium]|nr:hypothetical protein [Chloroflexota bacterium]